MRSEFEKPEADSIAEKIRLGVVNEWLRLGDGGFVEAIKLLSEEDLKPDTSLGQKARRLQGAGLIDAGIDGTKQATRLMMGFDCYKYTLVGLAKYIEEQGEQNAS